MVSEFQGLKMLERTGILNMQKYVPVSVFDVSPLERDLQTQTFIWRPIILTREHGNSWSFGTIINKEHIWIPLFMSNLPQRELNTVMTWLSNSRILKVVWDATTELAVIPNLKPYIDVQLMASIGRNSKLGLGVTGGDNRDENKMRLMKMSTVVSSMLGTMMGV